jgi:hypothetical protein
MVSGGVLKAIDHPSSSRQACHRCASLSVWLPTRPDPCHDRRSSQTPPTPASRPRGFIQGTSRAALRQPHGGAPLHAGPSYGLRGRPAPTAIPCPHFSVSTKGCIAIDGAVINLEVEFPTSAQAAYAFAHADMRDMAHLPIQVRQGSDGNAPFTDPQPGSTG